MLPARTQTCSGTQPSHAAVPTSCLQHQRTRHAPRHTHHSGSAAAFTASTQPPSSWGSNCASPAARQRRRPRLQLCPAAQAAPKVGVFPAGQRQARVELPALMVEVDAQEVLDSDDVCEAINAAVTAGATAIVLGDARASAAALYEAAVKLKELLRDRAALLLVDRTDIATAVKAEGVLLSDAGVPIVVARRMLQGGSTLVGRCVSSANDAAAAAADGANFVMLQAPGGELPQADEVSAARATQRSGNAIPVIAACSAAAAAEGLPPLTGTADGFSLPLSLLPAAAASLGALWGAPTAVQIGTLLQALTADGRAEGSSSSSGAGASGNSSSVAVDGSTLRRLMSAGREALVVDEKALLERVVNLLEEAAPQMEELVLLRDSLAALDDLFLVVVVGEFNSGKSTVINALLGERFLADGILPTTNEISVLKHAEDGRVSLEQQADGMYVRRLPAELLKELNIVDTPGTNVILERQQRLTEEYVPRADLVLFVMSADRPFAESEVRFLEYIRQWRKKVVFVVNKVDMLSNEDEVRQLTSFVSSNASRLLKLDDPHVLPISSRGALKAKLECGSATGSGVLSTVEDDLLVNHPSWQASRFGEFERFIYDFLVGGTSPSDDTSTSSSSSASTSASSSARAPPLSSARLSSGEGMRLKLQTPLFVGDALLQALSRQLAAEAEAARAELASLRAVRGQLTRFQNEMFKDGEAQRIACKGLVDEAIARSAKFIDKTLTLSNLPQLAAYVFGGSGASGLPVARGFDKEVAAGTVDQLAKQVGEHAGWLASNCSAQSDYYTDFLSRRRRPAGAPAERANSSIGNRLATDSADGDGQEAGPAPPEASSSGRPWDGAQQSRGAEVAGRSLAAVGDFKLEAAKMLLEEEVREAFLGTAGTAAGAQGLGLLAANYLGSTIEDVLALAVAGLASYVAVLNLPLRRADIKAKVSKVARNYVDTVTDTMRQELEASVNSTVQQVSGLVAPLESEWQEELSRLESTAARCEALIEELTELERRTANLQ